MTLVISFSLVMRGQLRVSTPYGLLALAALRRVTLSLRPDGTRKHRLLSRQYSDKSKTLHFGQKRSEFARVGDGSVELQKDLVLEFGVDWSLNVADLGE